MVEGAERGLFKELAEVETDIKTALKENDFKQALFTFTRLPTYINTFYDNTTINAEDKKLRENRLKLSALVVETYLKVADFDKL